jgi:ABC-type sulfate transport system permease component
MSEQPQSHWLTRKSTIKWLWIILIVTLAVTVAIEILMDHTPHFGKPGIESTFGFSAWYGFISCFLMVVFAKVLGWLIKRKDDYYD